MSCEDCEEQMPATVGRADVGQPEPDEDRIPGFIVPDPESYSGWRYYHVKRVKPGAPPPRQMGFRR